MRVGLFWILCEQDRAYVPSEKYKEHKSVVEIAYIIRVTRSPSQSSSNGEEEDEDDQWVQAWAERLKGWWRIWLWMLPSWCNVGRWVLWLTIKAHAQVDHRLNLGDGGWKSQGSIP